MSGWLVLAMLVTADKGGGDSCAERCAASVKPCSANCEKSFPKAKADQCKQACQGSVAPCKEHCATRGEQK